MKPDLLQNIDRDKYLSSALVLSKEEKNQVVKFRDWLPERIIDAHIHCNESFHVRSVPQKAFSHMISTYPYFTIEESKRLNKLLYPTKIIFSLRFANVFKGIDHRRANDYLYKNSPNFDRVALFGLPEDVAYTIAELKTGKYAALKMYYSYPQPTATSIYEVFKPDILEVAEDLDIPIILHTPQIITKSIQDIVRLCCDFPKLRITIAHLGSTKFIIPGLEDAYYKLSKFDNILLDSALNPSSEVCTLAIRAFGYERIIYGSDAPLNLLRSVAYIHPTKGQQIVTQNSYHWLDKNDYENYSHLARRAAHSHWAALGALQSAINSLPRGSRNTAKSRIFFDNAKRQYKF